MPVDALPNMPYWEAVGEPADTQHELRILIDQDRAAEEAAAAERAEQAASAAAAGEPKRRVLDLVDGDPAAAAAALAAEQEKDEPRPTLVAELEDITDRPVDAATSERD